MCDGASDPRPPGRWDAVATLRFADAAALERFHDPAIQQHLLDTREDFAEAADVFLVDEHTLIPPGGTPCPTTPHSPAPAPAAASSTTAHAAPRRVGRR